RLKSFEQNDSEVIAQFEDRREISYYLLVVADGANSVIRRQFLPEVLPEYACYVAWRGLVN
ncbi:MAG TPA: hypothetical protein PKY82_30860, partial [Pyrinomonadaceae bacterium]|nr:hypothetical protein [Pyrinomonadaceae bacterium]